MKKQAKGKRKQKRKNIFKKLQNTWQDKYKINAIGIPSQIDELIEHCNENKIYYSKPQYLYCAKKRMKIVFFDNNNQNKIKQIAKKYNKISINADIMTAKREL